MRGRWEAAFWKDAVDFLQVRNWKAEAREREDWKVIGKVMARKRSEAPGKMKKKTKKNNIIIYNTFYHFTQLTSAVEN